MTQPAFVPPHFSCGECGGTIARWPMVNLLRQEILDWRHVDVPAGVGPHRAVLGTPVPLAEVRLDEPAEEVAEPVVIPPPVVPARPALAGELPGPAQRLDAKAAANGWTVQAVYMHGPWPARDWKSYRLVEEVVLRLARDGHRLVASWQSDGDGWKAEERWSLTHTITPISAAELAAFVERPRLVCESCGEPPALHHSTEYGPVCHADFTNTPPEVPHESV